jgi:hypothetical protein
VYAFNRRAGHHGVLAPDAEQRRGLDRQERPQPLAAAEAGCAWLRDGRAGDLAVLGVRGCGWLRNSVSDTAASSRLRTSVGVVPVLVAVRDIG